MANFDAGGLAQDLVSKYLPEGVLASYHLAFPMHVRMIFITNAHAFQESLNLMMIMKMKFLRTVP